MFFNGHSNVHRREQRKYICLNSGNQYFNKGNKCHEQRAPNPHKDTLENKSKRQQAQDHNMACCNGHEKPEHQGKWF